MVATAQTISAPINLLLSGSAWALPGTPVTVSYDFLQAAPTTLLPVIPGDPAENVGWAPLTAAQQAEAVQAMALISSVANITFVSSTDQASANILIGTNNQSLNASAAYTSYGPGSSLSNGDFLMRQDHIEVANNQYIDQIPNNFTSVIFHELANSTGLKDFAGDTAIPAALNDYVYSVESYFLAQNYPDEYLYSAPGGANPITPQMLDIEAWQYLYGANQNGFTPTLPGMTESHIGNNHAYKFTDATSPLTVWIGANVSGLNAFDFSACTGVVTVDLTPGSMSGTGQYQIFNQQTLTYAPTEYSYQNVGLAFGTDVQIGVAGNAGATLYADATSKHDNLLIGGTGADTFIAGDGGDIFVGNGGHDVAEFHDPFADYKIVRSADGGMVVTDDAAHPTDGTVMLSGGFTTLEFADMTWATPSAGSAVSAVFDTAADLPGRLDELQAYVAAGYVSRIELVDAGLPSLSVTAAQSVNDAKALVAIASPYALTVPLDHQATNVIGPGNGVATTAILPDAASQYSIAPANGGVTVTEGGIVDHLVGVTAVQFSNGTIFFASPTPALSGGVSSAQIADLYAAVFARTPDAAGLAYYEQSAATNASLGITDYSLDFLSSPEYVQNSAHAYSQNAAGDAQFVTDTYQNLLHRAPEAGAVAWYQTNVVAPLLQGLTAGTSAYTSAELLAHAAILADFSQSQEFLGNVTVTATHPADSQHWLYLT